LDPVASIAQIAPAARARSPRRVTDSDHAAGPFLPHNRLTHGDDSLCSDRFKPENRAATNTEQKAKNKEQRTRKAEKLRRIRLS